VLSALGLGLIVYGVLRAGSWGFVPAEAECAEMVRVVAGGLAHHGRRTHPAAFPSWEDRLIREGKEPLINLPRMRNPVLRGGLIAFMFQYLLQAGLFFVVPLFLSVALGLSAIATGVRLLPLSITLLLAGRRCATTISQRLAAIGRPVRISRALRGDHGHGRAARYRRRARDRDVADAACRLGNRSACVAARSRHRVVGFG